MEVTASMEAGVVHEDESGIVSGDLAMIERAVMNVLDNAVKWSPPGGTVNVEIAGTTITVTDNGARDQPGRRPSRRQSVLACAHGTIHARLRFGPTAGTAELKSVAGNVVWEVDVTATAGGSYDVIVDAGSSTVVDTHIEGGGRHKGHRADDEAASAAASTATTG